MIKLLNACALSLLVVGPSLAQTANSAKTTTPVKVAFRKQGQHFQLLRADQPYFVKGASGSQYPDRIAAYGGNSIRTWSSRNAQPLLDSAQHYGLTVLMGLEVARQRHGFNYDDTTAVKQQLQVLKAEVLKYKDHPALLAWGIGNELNLQYSNPKVWNAVNDISKMIHALDPNHPTCTVLAGISKDLVDNIRQRCPDIDFLGVNTYGGLATLPKAIANAGWQGAYLVTEWAPTGHWEGLSTEWKAPIEETSSEKAAVYKSRYEASVEQDTNKCLGSYVFLWGQKQERTPTWYGLFTERGEETEVMDALQYEWMGRWPANKAPHVYSLQVGGKKAVQNVHLQAGGTYPVLAVVTDPDQDSLSYRWEVLAEPTQVGEGGDYEARPKAVANALLAYGTRGQATMKAPERTGAYRLFVYVTDGHNKVATANLPFYVNP